MGDLIIECVFIYMDKDTIIRLNNNCARSMRMVELEQLMSLRDA